MTVDDIPVVSFSKRLLDPSIIWGVLYIVTVFYDEHFSGYYLLLAILVFFVSSFVYEQIDPYRSWRSGKMLAYARDIFIGWIVTVAILYWICTATDLINRYHDDVLLAWVSLTPCVLFLSHLASVAVDFAKHGECCSKSEYLHLEKLIKRWPDFMEK